MFSEREKSKQQLNDYLKNTLNVSSIEAKKDDINVIDDISNVIVNRHNENNNNEQSNYSKIKQINRNKNNSIQLKESDVREYAMNMPVKSNLQFFLIKLKNLKNLIFIIKNNLNILIFYLKKKANLKIKLILTITII